MYETAIPMGKMLNAFLAIHGRCKFIIFLRGQTPSLSAPTLILSLMEHFQGKAKNTVKHSIKSTFSISIQINCNWLPGNPQLPPYINIDVQYLGRDHVGLSQNDNLQIPVFKTSYTSTRYVDCAEYQKVRDQLYCQRYKVFPTSRAANSKGRSSSHAAAGPQKATNARNQRSRNSYPRFRPRQSPARPKPRYNAKSARARRSSIYPRFCVSLAPRRRCKQPRPKTSIAGTAIVDSGNQHNTELLLCGFPPYPPKIGNRKPESHARKRIVVCMRFFSLPFQQVQALSTLFPTSFSSLPSLSPGRASTKSSLPTMRVARKRIG